MTPHQQAFPREEPGLMGRLTIERQAIRPVFLLRRSP